MKGKVLSFLMICSGLLLYGVVAMANPAGHLVMPVQFTIENGDYTASIVTVKKNGTTVITENGKKNLRLKLEYGNNYLLSFSKPGYITKMIKVDTKVSTGFSKTGFDPYKIGVCIFKQYDGVNTVVYNQPVAFIRYHPEIDEFGYDVDYTKSILSSLTVAENALAKKAEEERVQNKQPSTGISLGGGDASADNPKAVNQDQLPLTKKNNLTGQDNQKVNNEKTISSDSPANVDNNKGSSALDNQKNQAGNTDSQNANPKSGVDQPSLTVTNSTSDIHRNKISGADGKDKIIPAEGTNGNEVPKNNFPKNSGADPKLKNNISSTNETRTVVETVEPNRVITTIRISNGDHYSEYRKVNYNWGGVYFFRDNDASISEQLFFLLSAGK